MDTPPIPFTAPSLLRDAALRATRTRLPRAESIPALRVLAIDDELAIREVLDLCLTADGHTVKTAADGRAGIDEFHAGKWDIVLVDGAMPGMDGGEVAAEIKKLDPHMPVVMVTGSRRRAGELGDHALAIDAFVWKPFTLDDLRTGIGSALRAHPL